MVSLCISMGHQPLQPYIGFRVQPSPNGVPLRFWELPHLDTQVKKFGVDMYSMAYYPLIPGSPTAAEVIEQGYGDKCLMMGNIDPQLFVRASTEQIAKVTADLCQEVKTALCKKGLNSRYCISSGCEVPPDLETKLENVDAVMAAVHEYGKM